MAFISLPHLKSMLSIAKVVVQMCDSIVFEIVTYFPGTTLH